MSVTKDPRTNIYDYEFRFKGHRHRGTTQKRSKREAQAVERAVKERVREEYAATNIPSAQLTTTEAAARYVSEIVADKEIEQQLARGLRALGTDKRITDVTDNDITKLVATLRGLHKWDREDMPLLSPATVNRTGIELWRRVFRRAKELWGVRFPHEPKWGRHRLKEPPERNRELRSTERVAINESARDDYGKVYTFARLTGFRQTECLLRVGEVHWDAEKIIKLGKGGKKITADITPAVAALLRSCPVDWDGDPNAPVFTYVCQRTEPSKGLVRGKRFPITVQGLKSDWRRTRDRSGVKNFRFHDFRHDFGTKVQRAGRNPKVTQHAMNHSNMASTFRYIAVGDEEVRSAVEAAQRDQTTLLATPVSAKKAS